MPRSNRPRRRSGASGPGRGEEGVARLQRLSRDVVEYAGQAWTVRRVRGNDSGRSYRCPGCQQEVSAAVPHTVVWPSEAMRGVDNRRHWHIPCWDSRDRRRPGGSWA